MIQNGSMFPGDLIVERWTPGHAYIVTWVWVNLLGVTTMSERERERDREKEREISVSSWPSNFLKHPETVLTFPVSGGKTTDFSMFYVLLVQRFLIT